MKTPKENSKTAMGTGMLAAFNKRMSQQKQPVKNRELASTAAPRRQKTING